MSTMICRDLSFENHGTLFLARPVGERGQTWLDEHCPQGDDHTYWGDVLVVERRYAAQLAQAASDDGLGVS
jgi:hypothetical protein